MHRVIKLQKYSDIQNVDKPIRINFHDGHVEDIICTEPSDTTNSLNIKRAIASLFQVSFRAGICVIGSFL